MDKKKMIGSRIREIRTKRGMTQEILAEKMGIGPKYLSSIERGKENPTLDTLIRLAESLEVDMGEIFGFVEIEDSDKLRILITSLLGEANSEQLKVAFKLLSAIIP